MPDSIAKVTSAYKLLSLARERITPLSILEKDPGNAQALAELARIDAEAKAILKTYNAAGDAVKKRAVEVAALRAAADAGNPANQDARDRRIAGGGRSLPDVPDPAAAKAAAEARRKAAEEAAKALVDIETQAAQDTAEAWKYWEKQQIDDAQARADAFKLQWQQVFETIDAEQEQAIADGKAYLDALAKDGQNAGEQIALALSSAASQAINNWQGLGNLVKGILKDLAQLALSEAVLKPASNWLSSSLSGFSWSKLLGGLPSFDVGTPYVPRDMVAKVHKGERIVPAAQNRGSGTGGAGSLTYSPVINVDSRTDQAQVVQLVGQMLAADKQALFEYMRAQGAM